MLLDRGQIDLGRFEGYLLPLDAAVLGMQNGGVFLLRRDLAA